MAQFETKLTSCSFAQKKMAKILTKTETILVIASVLTVVMYHVVWIAIFRVDGVLVCRTCTLLDRGVVLIWHRVLSNNQLEPQQN